MYMLKIGVCVLRYVQEVHLHDFPQNDPFQWNFKSTFLKLSFKFGLQNLVNMGSGVGNACKNLIPKDFKLTAQT